MMMELVFLSIPLCGEYQSHTLSFMDLQPWNFTNFLFYFAHIKQLPEDLPFEYLLKHAEELYKQYPPDIIEKDVEEMIIKE